MQKFKDRKAHESQTLESSDSDVKMASTRLLISQLNLSGKDELGNTNATRLRPTYRRSLSNASRPPPRRGSYQRGPLPVLESSAGSSDSEASKRRKAQTTHTLGEGAGR